MPGEQLDKLTINASGGSGFGEASNQAQQHQQQSQQQKIQPSKEDIEAIRV